MQAAQNQKQTNTASLAKFLKLKTGAKVMLTVNTDIRIVRLMVIQELLGTLNLLKLVLERHM